MVTFEGSWEFRNPSLNEPVCEEGKQHRLTSEENISNGDNEKGNDYHYFVQFL